MSEPHSGNVAFQYDSYQGAFRKMVWQEGGIDPYSGATIEPGWVQADDDWYSDAEVAAFTAGKTVSQVRKEAAGGQGGETSAGGQGGETSIAIANINAQQRSLDRASEEKIAAIRDAREAINQDIARERLALDKAQADDDLVEQIRHNRIIEGLYAKDRELAQAQFKWGQETDTQKLALEEHRNRIQEAGVTGYYRPSASTPFSRPVSNTAMAASAPTPAREQWQASRQNQPVAALRVAAPPPIAATTPQQAAPAPVNTSGMNLAELSAHYQQQQTGPPAQGEAAKAPNAQPNEQPIQSGVQRLKREIKEYY